MAQKPWEVRKVREEETNRFLSIMFPDDIEPTEVSSAFTAIGSVHEVMTIDILPELYLRVDAFTSDHEVEDMVTRLKSLY